MRGRTAVLLLLLPLVLFSCGLDTFYYLEPPTLTHPCTPDTADNAELYVEFMTSEAGENAPYISGTSDFSFTGTAVYYRIYDSSSAVSSVAATINSLNGSSSSSAAQRLFSLGYKALALSGGERRDPLVKPDGTNRYVYIRLSGSDGGEDSFKPALRAGTSSISDSTGGSDLFSGQYPVRLNGERFDDKENRPSRGDEDVSFTQNEESPATLYVDLYAFSCGYDTGFTRSYSEVTHLGTIPVKL